MSEGQTRTRTYRGTPAPNGDFSKRHSNHGRRSSSPEALKPPLPHNLDAERSVLGAILLDNHKLDAVLEKLKPEDFFSVPYRCIFGHMIELGEAKQVIDDVTLTDYMRRKGTLEVAGGAACISQLSDGMPRVSNVGYHAKIIKRKAAQRLIIYATQDTQERAFADEEEPCDILGRHTLALSAISERQDAENIFETWEEFQNAKPLRTLIDGFLWADVSNILAGLSGSGKTLIALSTDKALLTGAPLFGHFRVLEQLDRCIYLIPECARTPFLHRARLFGLESYLENGRLLVRTLTKGPRIDLDDPRLLRHVRDAVVTIDTAVRYVEGDESSASDIANGLATDVFGLLSAGAAGVKILQHSPKGFAKENFISLENCLRGSGDIGAFVGAGFGIRQIDVIQNVIHLEDIKPRDAEPTPPFQIIGRPYIDQQGDFRIQRAPGACGKLSEYVDEFASRKRGGAPNPVREAKAANMELLRQWLKEDPTQSSEQLSGRFKEHGIDVSATTVRKYKQELNK